MQRQKQKNILREYDRFLRHFHKKIDFYTHLLDPTYTAPREISELRTQIQKKMSELESKDIDDDLVKKIYLNSLENAREQATILESRNRKNDMLTSGSRKLWGEPDYQSYRKALKMLKRSEEPDKTVEELEKKKKIGAVEMRKWLETVLKELEIPQWNIPLKENSSTVSVSSANRKLNLPRDRKFSELEAFRLALHEIGRHIITFENGQKQRYKVMALGVGGYENIDEGIAVYMEKESGLITEKVLKKYAARLVAVFQMNQGQTREEIKENLDKLGLDPKLSENILQRVFTGHGLSRDHIYLEGLIRIESWLEDGGDLNDVFIGKVPLKYCEELASRNEIKKPEQDMKELTTDFYSRMKPLWEEKME